jgi:hypothetical protein
MAEARRMKLPPLSAQRRRRYAYVRLRALFDLTVHSGRWVSHFEGGNES